MAARLSFYFAIITTLSAISSVNGFPDGAPEGYGVCVGMTPGHTGVVPDPGPLLYDFLVSETSIAAGTPLTVTVKVQEAEGSPASFKGFLLQARKTDGSEDVEGTWIPNEELSHGITCNDVVNGALTHNSRDEKTELVVQWNPPGPGEYEILLTVVEMFTHFWVAQKSPVITVTE